MLKLYSITTKGEIEIPKLLFLKKQSKHLPQQKSLEKKWHLTKDIYLKRQLSEKITMLTLILH